MAEATVLAAAVRVRGAFICTARTPEKVEQCLEIGADISDLRERFEDQTLGETTGV